MHAGSACRRHLRAAHASKCWRRMAAHVMNVEDDDFSSQKQQQKARGDEEEDSRSNNSDEDNETLEYEEYESEEQLPFDDAEYKNNLAPSLRAKFYPSDNLPV